MTSAVRVIRFARVDPTASSTPEGRTIVARVLLDEAAASAGQIVRDGRMWGYLLAGGVPSGLSSAESRQDLERQIVLYHLGTIPVAESTASEKSLKLAM